MGDTNTAPQAPAADSPEFKAVVASSVADALKAAGIADLIKNQDETLTPKPDPVVKAALDGGKDNEPAPHYSSRMYNTGVSPAVRMTGPVDANFAGRRFAQSVRATVLSCATKRQGDYKSPVQCASGLYGESHPVTTAMEAAVKNAAPTSSSSTTNAGVLIPPGFTQEYIMLLRPRTVFLSANPMEVPNPTGNVPIPKQLSGASAAYITEGASPTVTGATWGQENAVSKILSATILMGRVFLDRVDVGTDRMLIEDLLKGASQKLDTAALRSNGSGGEPKGLRYWAAAGNVFAAENPAGGDTATVALGKVQRTLTKLWLKLMEANIPISNLHMFVGPRTFMDLSDRRDGNGNLAFPSINQSGTYKQVPISWTTNMPENLGGGSDADIILAEMSEVAYVNEQAVRVKTSEEAAVLDGGVVRSAFSEDFVAVQLTDRHDIVARHATAIAVATGATWGTSV